MRGGRFSSEDSLNPFKKKTKKNPPFKRVTKREVNNLSFLNEISNLRAQMYN